MSITMRRLIPGWVDQVGGAFHQVEGFRVSGFSEAMGGPVAWWAYAPGYRRVRLKTEGPEPLGPFRTMDEAKEAAEAAWMRESWAV